MSDIVSAKWGESHPSLADFACAILDMKLYIDVEAVSIPTVEYPGYSFYRLSDDVVRLLQAGGVVVCLNYYTFANKASLIFGSKILNAIYSKRQAEYSYEHKFTGQEEVSYDWLDLGFLKTTRLDQMNIRPGLNFKVVSKLDCVERYFWYVKEYHKVINGIRRDLGVWRGKISSYFRSDPSYDHAQETTDDVNILAVSTVTDEPIAAAIKYRGFPGTLVFLPTYCLPQSTDPSYKETARSIASALSRLGEYYYETSKRELGMKLELPPWVLQYRSKVSTEADEELELLEKKKTELLGKRDRYDRMLTLISGYGDALQEAVAELFGGQWLGFNVERTEVGHPIDLFIKNAKTGQALAVQVTGVSGKFTQKDKHFGALMAYLPENEEKNVGGQFERIVLVINTYRDTPLASRTDEDDISPHVRNLVERNGVCLIKTCNLYNLWNLWVESPEKLPADDIFKQLFDCKGIWLGK